jgi:selenium-binding protein 1
MVSSIPVRFIAPSIAIAFGLAALLTPISSAADETCNSPYMANLIKGQEDYIYVWTLGVEGLGDGQDKLVTIDANPASPKYGKVTATAPVGERGEAHHMGFTDDRRRIWAGGLAGSDIYMFDIAADPARPRLVKTIKDLAAKTGFIGPHTYYALPGRMLVQTLSNDKDKGRVTDMALYNNEGDFIARYPMPVDNGGDGYGYDLAVNPTKNVLLTSSFTGHANYMRPLGELIKDEAAMKRFGHTMVAWDLKAMKPKTVMQVPGAPLEIRWSLSPGDDWAVTAAALTSKLWLVRPDASGQWQAKEAATIRRRFRCPSTSASAATARGSGSTRSWTA